MSKIIALLLFAVAFYPLVVTANEEPKTFLLGGMLKEGGILPIAVYSKGVWSNNWEGEISGFKAGSESWNKAVEEMKKTAEVPLAWITPLPSFPMKWFYFLKNGKSGSLKLNKIELQDVSDIASELCVVTSIKPNCYGVAFGGADMGRLYLPRDMNLKENDRITSKLKSDFEEAELKTVLKQKKVFETLASRHKDDPSYLAGVNSFPGNLTTEVQKTQKVEVESLQEVADGDSGFVYFFLTRKYPTSINGYRFNFVTYMFGWGVKNNDGSVKIIEENVGFINGDGRVSGFGDKSPYYDLYNLESLGCFKLDGKEYWVFHAKYYEAEGFLMVDVGLNGCKPVVW